MMIRYIKTALLLSIYSLFFVDPCKSFEYEWDLALVAGYPVIAFDDTTPDSEVVFLYNFTGTLSETKYLEVVLYESDCESPADPTALIKNETVDGHELQVNIDVVQSMIKDSIQHYSESLDGIEAHITFCVRVDYYYVDTNNEPVSINFQQTAVDIAVDLTSNTTIGSATLISQPSGTSDEAYAQFDYPVESYYCDDNNNPINPGLITNGKAIQICVNIDETARRLRDLAGLGVYTSDIIGLEIKQPGGPPEATPTKVINGRKPDRLTNKSCNNRKDGKCNIKVQLPSKYFKGKKPADLRLDGQALLSFGDPATVPDEPTTAPAPGNSGNNKNKRRRLGKFIPINNLATQSFGDMDRQLGLDHGQNPFDMTIELIGDEEFERIIESEGPVVPQSNTTLLQSILALLIISVLLLGWIVSIQCYGTFFKKKDKMTFTKDDEELLIRLVSKTIQKHQSVEPNIDSKDQNSLSDQMKDDTARRLPQRSSSTERQAPLRAQSFDNANRTAGNNVKEDDECLTELRRDRFTRSPPKRAKSVERVTPQRIAPLRAKSSPNLFANRGETTLKPDRMNSSRRCAPERNMAGMRARSSHDVCKNPREMAGIRQHGRRFSNDEGRVAGYNRKDGYQTDSTEDSDGLC